MKLILVAEDDENDYLLMKLAFGKLGPGLVLRRVCNGDEVIAYIRGEGIYRDRQQYPFPDLLLLDLKMPGKSGFEVLKWIRSQPCLKRLIVAILTASTDREDIARAYNSFANSYLIKPDSLDQLVTLVRKVKEYWLELNTNPFCSATEN